MTKQAPEAVPSEIQLIKGDKGGECYRLACRNAPATCYNRCTDRYYCIPCAHRINSYADIQPPLCIIEEIRDV